MESRATRIGSPTPLPGSGAKTATPARSPTTDNWSTALGRCKSAATNRGECPCSFKYRASLPASVVLPAPCRPARTMTVGAVLANLRRRVSPPKMVMSCSCTILTICCPGLSAPETSADIARSRIAEMNCRTTGRATSASRRAIRISRSVSSMSASERRPLPRNPLKVAARRSDNDANMYSPDRRQ